MVVAVGTITGDLVLTDPDEVANYAYLYERLRSAAISPAESLDSFASVADGLPAYTRR
ncbi:Scr1 family TA system antitoxin-like transcriptional regulator [Micromonospora sp. NPDC049230]|uniref:Scr1 family TA system antitoxin-like transcriptional regulator n=1 Tax=Micromonospora sp. NPDC049230 TaxID=3155502 RepID=UPI0033EF6D59